MVDPKKIETQHAALYTMIPFPEYRLSMGDSVKFRNITTGLVVYVNLSFKGPYKFVA